jgi:hypothetical protein
MAILAAAALDDISGTDRETLGQGTRLTICWQTHGTISFSFDSRTPEFGTPVAPVRFVGFSDDSMTAVDCCG